MRRLGRAGAVLLFILAVLWPRMALAIVPPTGVEAADMPDDGGGAILLTWRAAPTEGPETRTEILAAASEDGPFHPVAEFSANTHYASDLRRPWWISRGSRDWHTVPIRSTPQFPLVDGHRYSFRVVTIEGLRRAEGPVVSAVPRPNLFNRAKLNNLLLLTLLAALVLLSIRHARRHPGIFLRRIPGLDAVEEAIGRATEMGRPILYLTGSDDLSSISTIAATIILGEVAKRVATYETRILVPHRDPVVMAVCQEIVKEACISAGRPDVYRAESNFFITTDQFSYTAAVDGIMLRERPAANFFMGFYYAESLLLAETGASTGAIQIAGTDSDTQLPFFITSCDYTLIGEELYAASAYLSREPVLVGTLRGQDLGKAVLLLVLVLGTAAATLGKLLGTTAFDPFLQLFRDFR